ncbi:MAG: hypothetical protein WCP97_00055 [bacterium]
MFILLFGLGNTSTSSVTALRQDQGGRSKNRVILRLRGLRSGQAFLISVSGG